MATFSTFKKKNRYKTLSLLFLIFSFFLFLFARRIFFLGSDTTLYADVISQTPLAFFNSSISRSIDFQQSFDGSNQIVVVDSDSEDNLDFNTTSKGDSDEGDRNAAVYTRLAVDGRSDKNITVPIILKNEGDPFSSDEKIDDSISKKSDFGDVNVGGAASGDSLDVEADEEPMLLNENLTSPILQEPNFDEKSSADENPFDRELAEKLSNCDIYKGRWVKDEDYPLYREGSCPYVDEAYDCQSNGRQDSEYMKWRWKPDDCDLPRFNATDFLSRLRGKSLMLVGDSMNRNQFESLLCLLREGLSDKSRMYEVHGYKITKGRGYYVFKIKDYDCSVIFVRSHFLVREGVRINGQGNSNPTLSIDRIDKTANRWKKADILVFNTGHWWTHGKTSRGKNYYKEGDHLYPHLDAVEAYRRAIKTWAKWIKANIKPDKLVFYRGYSSAHFRGGDWNSGGSCNGETEPVKSGPIIDSYPEKMKIVEEVIEEVQVPAVLLNMTRLTNYRKDGHPSVYGKNVTGQRKVSTRRQDCSHWCLPGVPDAWNELIYATLIARTIKIS